jgi:GNAT superfamily N-acetyltransferase
MEWSCPDPLLAMALDCVDLFYERTFRRWPAAVTENRDGWLLSFSGDTYLSGANHLWPQTPAGITSATLEAAATFFDRFDAAWSVVYTDSLMPDRYDVLIQHRFQVRWTTPLMVLDQAPRFSYQHPHYRPIRAATPQHLRDVVRVMEDAFATNDSVNSRVVQTDHLDDATISHYLLYQDGTPACCATVARCGDMAGIWNVGTRYRFRRQGFATAIMHVVLDELRAEGCELSALMASPAGQPLYEKLGYRQIGTTSYMGPPPYSARSSNR